MWAWKFLKPERKSCGLEKYPDTCGRGLIDEIADLIKQVCLPCIISNVTNNTNKWTLKNCWTNKFSKTPSAILVNFKFVHPFAPCNGIQDSSGLWIPRRGFWIAGTVFQSLSE